MISFIRANGEMKHDGSDEDSEEENEEGDYTVYECPGLAPVSIRNTISTDYTLLPNMKGTCIGAYFLKRKLC